jgi:putative peptide zinc metalloprotease protein
VALGLIIGRFSDFATMFQLQYFTLYNLGYMFMTIWFIKGLHELGHGLTCKNYGGEVHEMGYFCLVFMPFLYCNVTDSWTFTQKRSRFLVTAAGIMTEMFLASLFAIIWYFTESPSFIHSLSFNLMVACSISTLLFNANPLLKFDGYYMPMDLIEVPNLRQRAGRFMNGLVVRYLLGGYAEELREEHRFRILFPIYSVAASIYRWFITISILTLVYRYLDQVNLQWLGMVMVVFSLMTMLIYPMIKTRQMISKKTRSLWYFQ